MPKPTLEELKAERDRLKAKMDIFLKEMKREQEILARDTLVFLNAMLLFTKKQETFLQRQIVAMYIKNEAAYVRGTGHMLSILPTGNYFKIMLCRYTLRYHHYTGLLITKMFWAIAPNLKDMEDCAREHQAHSAKSRASIARMREILKLLD